MNSHAYLSPSGSRTWLHSPACWFTEAEKFTKEEQEFYNGLEAPNTASQEGTLGHEIAERLLRQEYAKKPEVVKPLRRLRKSKYFTHQLESYARWCHKEASEIIDSYDDDALLYFEKRVAVKSVHDELWGTSDIVLVSGGVLHIIDFKFGRLPVHAKDNPQLKIYAQGAIDTLGVDVKTVRATILQPRNYDVDTVEIGASELRAWIDKEVKPKALDAVNRQGTMKPDVSVCRYCKHRVTDKKHRDMFMSIIRYEEGRTVDELDYEEIEAIALNAPALIAWIKEVEKYAKTKAFGGHDFKNLKLVRGHSRRAFSNTKRVERRLKRLDFEYLDAPKIKPLTEIEAMLGKTKFNDVLGDLIIKNVNQPRLVANSSKEKPYHKTNDEIADEFGI